MKVDEILFWIVKVIFVIFFIIAIIQLVLKITGHSPIDVQLLYIIVGGIVSYLFIASYKMGKFIGEMREFKEITKNSFSKMGEDMIVIKDDITKLKR